MILISSRYHLRESDAFGEKDEYYDATFTAGGAVTLATKSSTSVRSAINGKKVLLLVHGYNNDFDDVCRAYNIIERGLSSVNTDYDEVVGYTWPGGDQAYEYPSARRRSSVAAGRLLDISRSFSPASLDVMTHSMGARVVFRMLQDITSRNPLFIRNHFATASAVDDESIERGEKFYEATQRCETTWVFHSKHDRVLKLWYRIGDLDSALGLHGPDDRQAIERHSKNVKVVNCRHHVKSHGDYKKTAAFYTFIEGILGGTQPVSRQFFTL